MRDHALHLKREVARTQSSGTGNGAESALRHPRSSSSSEAHPNRSASSQLESSSLNTKPDWSYRGYWVTQATELHSTTPPSTLKLNLRNLSLLPDLCSDSFYPKGACHSLPAVSPGCNDDGYRCLSRTPLNQQAIKKDQTQARENKRKQLLDQFWPKICDRWIKRDRERERMERLNRTKLTFLLSFILCSLLFLFRDIWWGFS